MLVTFSPKIQKNLKDILIVCILIGIFSFFVRGVSLQKLFILYLIITVNFIIFCYFVMKEIKIIDSNYIVFQNFGFKKIKFNQKDIKFLNEISLPLRDKLEHLEIHLQNGQVIRVFRHYILNFDKLKRLLEKNKLGV